MPTPTIESLTKELADQKKLMETVAKQANEDRRVVMMLVAAGFVTDEKVEEARAILRPLR